MQVSRVEPKRGPLLGTIVGATLRHFVMVMREQEVFAARVEVQMFAECDAGQCRAFDVPARSAHSPWTLPGGLRLLFSRLP